MFEKFFRNYGGDEESNAPDWTYDECYNINLMIMDGLVRSEKVIDAPWLQGPAPDDSFAETYISITTAGHNYIEASNWIFRAWKNIQSNIPTIIASVGTAILLSWAIYYFGAPSK